MSNIDESLPARLAQRLRQPSLGCYPLVDLQPELSYGRHRGPAPENAPRAAVVVLLYPHREQWYIPLTQRPTHLKHHAGQVSLPGGSIEPDETASQAALRELEEELAVPPGEVSILGELSPLYVYASGFLVTPFVATTPERPEMVPSPDEVAELLEVPVQELLDQKIPSIHLYNRRGIRFTAPHFSWERHRIWGATAMILAELLAVVQGI